MLRLSFPFRLWGRRKKPYQLWKRNDSWHQFCFGRIQSSKKKEKNKDIGVAQKFYCILLKIYGLGLANLNLANLYMSTSSALERSFPRDHFKWVATSLWRLAQIWNVNWSMLSSLSISCSQVDNSYVLLCSEK